MGEDWNIPDKTNFYVLLVILTGKKMKIYTDIDIVKTKTGNIDLTLKCNGIVCG